MSFLNRLFIHKRKLLLHICCTPCGSYISRDILQPKYDLTWYFYNPNLCCREEYEKRLEYVKLIAAKFNIPLIVEPYHHSIWQEKMIGRENDPEKGERCRLCYEDRLLKTAQIAKERGFTYFSTSLLVSPYKDTLAIRKIAEKLAKEQKINFLKIDFQKNDGYRRSQELAKELNIYRQKFCGCEYSLKQKI